MQDYNPTILTYLFLLKTSVENGLSTTMEHAISFGFRSYGVLYSNMNTFYAFMHAMLLQTINASIVMAGNLKETVLPFYFTCLTTTHVYMNSAVNHALNMYETSIPMFHSAMEWIAIQSVTARKAACSFNESLVKSFKSIESETMMEFLCYVAFIATLASVFQTIYRIESALVQSDSQQSLKKRKTVERKTVDRKTKGGIPIIKSQSSLIAEKTDSIGEQYKLLLTAHKELMSENARLKGDCDLLAETNDKLTVENDRLKEVEKLFIAEKEKREQSIRKRLETTRANLVIEAREKKRSIENELLRRETEKEERAQRLYQRRIDGMPCK